MRIVLFLLMQVAILVIVSIVGTILMKVFGIRMNGSSYTGLLAMCAVFGFVGSFVSLLASKFICKHSYGVQVISNPQTPQEVFLFNTIYSMSQRAGFDMPEVGIYHSPDPNAFATGASKNKALVAVSTGLLETMNEEEVRGVLGHEISHIQNGDMVTMSLLQGVLNTFVYFFSYIAASAVSSAMNRNSDSSERSNNTWAFHLSNMIFQMIFGVLANLILMWYSRQREFRADEGSAKLEGKECMIKALMALQRGVQPQEGQQEGQLSALCINGATSMSELFMSHPPLEKRIANLRNQAFMR